MSGGVDSSVTAFLLKREGYDVVGVTFRNWPQDCISRAEDKCCGPQAVTDARAVAHQIGIPHYLVDEIDAFQREVIEYFGREYARGRTPNPCVVCNEKIKFGTLLNKARALGAEFIATGHYARVERVSPNSEIQNPHFLLKRGLDPHKDQSYFLFSLRQEQLARALMPLGALSKDETRSIAAEMGLKTHDKVESQEICFVPENDYGHFLREGLGMEERAGEIVDTRNRVLGTHNGVQFFTIGQREGLGLATRPLPTDLQGKPLYVVALDAEANRVVVGENDALLRDEFTVERVNWIPFDEPSAPLEATVKIRYNHPGTPATIEPRDNGYVRVHLREPQRAITPGQAAVFYQGDRVLGGGWICA
jgi:tRNA-specific 2-thiouridylase